MNVLVNHVPCTMIETAACRYVVWSGGPISGEGAAGPVVRVRLENVSAKVVVRPLAAGVVAEPVDGTVEFDAPVPGKLSVEFYEGERPDTGARVSAARAAGRKPLFLFLYGPEDESAWRDRPGVKFYGPGRHREERLELKSGETLYLAEGAFLSAPLVVDGAENVSVRGRGVLDLEGEPAERGRRMSNFHDCRGLDIRDVTFAGSSGWCCVVSGCSDVRVEGINILSWIMTGDGIDVVGSHDVHIRGCFFFTADDCIVLKSVAFRGPKGMQNVYNVLAERCVCWNERPGNALEIGFETRCEEIHHVTFRDIDVIHCEPEGWQSGGILTIHNGDRARVHDIVYRDIRIEDANDKLFDFKVLESNYSKDDRRGSVEDILVENVSVVDGAFPPSIMSGFAPEDSLVRRVKFRNVTVLGQKLLSFNDARMVAERVKEISFE